MVHLFPFTGARRRLRGREHRRGVGGVSEGALRSNQRKRSFCGNRYCRDHRAKLRYARRDPSIKTLFFFLTTTCRRFASQEGGSARPGLRLYVLSSNRFLSFPETRPEKTESASSRRRTRKRACAFLCNNFFAPRRLNFTTTSTL